MTFIRTAHLNVEDSEVLPVNDSWATVHIKASARRAQRLSMKSPGQKGTGAKFVPYP
jgi:hypothetical protein